MTSPNTPIFIPYNGRIVEGVVEAILAQGFVPNAVECTSPDTYCNLLAYNWPLNDFIIVEHDNLLMDHQNNLLSLQELIDCPEPWCGYEYQLGINTQMEAVYECAFGMTCFKQIRSLLPGIWEEPSLDVRYINHSWKTKRHWEGMDLYFRARAEQIPIKQHCHGRGQHLKDFNPPGQDKLKTFMRELMIRFS